MGGGEVGTICQLGQLLLLLLVVILLLLVSYNVIFFGLFMPMSHGVNKKTPPSASHHLPPHYQVFTRFVYCFTRNA